MYALLCGVPPFQAAEMTVPATYDNISNDKWSFRPHGAQSENPNIPLPSEAAQHLPTEMLRPEPAERITPPDILMHPWLSNDGTGDLMRIPQHLPVSVLVVPPEDALLFTPPELPVEMRERNVLLMHPGTPIFRPF